MIHLWSFRFNNSWQFLSTYFVLYTELHSVAEKVTRLRSLPLESLSSIIETRWIHTTSLRWDIRIKFAARYKNNKGHLKIKPGEAWMQRSPWRAWGMEAVWCIRMQNEKRTVAAQIARAWMSKVLVTMTSCLDSAVGDTGYFSGWKWIGHICSFSKWKRMV